MPVFVVITCKKCKWKTEVPVISHTTIFGETLKWQDANPKKCKGCGYDHGIRISVKNETVRPSGISAGVHAKTASSRKGRPRIGTELMTDIAQQPWKRLGVSERTYYRRKAEGTLP